MQGEKKPSSKNYVITSFVEFLWIRSNILLIYSLLRNIVEFVFFLSLLRHLKK